MEKKEKKIIYINLDGFSYSYYEKLKKENQHSIIEKLKEEGLFFSNLHSGLISITNPMQSAILCGAWSNKTHNFYQHFDKEKREVVKHKRKFDAQNIGNLFVEKGKNICSIHQFMLENNPCVEGDFHRAYFKAEKEHSNYFDRFSILKKILRKEEVVSGDKRIRYTEIPDFIALYIDDLDSLGHNNDYEEYKADTNPENRFLAISERIKLIFKEIDEVVSILKEEKIFDDFIILITTDHGMTPFYGKSMLNTLKNEINMMGIKTSLKDEVTNDTEIVLLEYTIECSLYYLKEISIEKEKKLINLLNSLNFINNVLDKNTMMQEYGLADYGPDLLVCPKAGYHFYHRDFETIYGASHDSLDESSQHIFGLILSSNVNKYEDNDLIYSIDLLPTILKCNNNLKLKDSYGKIYNNWFKE